jgi:hypothetical protein
MLRRVLAFAAAFGLIAVLPGVVTGLADVDTGFPNNEPHAGVVNPLNPANVVVSNVNQLVISTDFGVTFPTVVNSAANFPATTPGYGRCGDDVITFDAAGRLFWSYLKCRDGDSDGKVDTLAAGDDITIVVEQVNPTTGAKVGSPVDVTPGFHFDDKQWIAADANPASPFTNNLYLHWTRFDASPTAEDFSRSTNQGVAWSAPAAVASGAGEGFRHQAHVAVALNGDVYLSYHAKTCGGVSDGLVEVIRDSTGGSDLAAGTVGQKTSFAAEVSRNTPPDIPGTQFLTQGSAVAYVIPDPARPGNVYVVTNDDPNNDPTTGDGGDVILARSTDYGNTWSVNTISHAPAGTLQVFPTGAIDQGGNLMVFWYDTRRGLTNAGGKLLLDIFATVSRDGAQTFTNDFRINDASFDPDLGAPCFKGCGGVGDPPPATLRIGEYNGASAANGVGYAAFTGNSATGQEVYFDTFSILGQFPDRFEPNDAISPGVVTDLGAAASYSEPDLTIHAATDEDFFKVTALRTGTMRFAIALNGRVADLDIQVRDKFNNVVATSSSGADSNNTEAITIPAVAGEPYYLRVLSAPGQLDSANTYDLAIDNTPAPVPFALDLRASSDSGASSSDDLTNISAATVDLRLDESALAGLALSPQSGLGTFADDAPGYKVVVYNGGVQAGVATRTSAGLYTFTFPGDAPLSDGPNSITARVVIVDPSTSGGGLHVVGIGDESSALTVTLDTSAPTAPSAIDLLASSDTAGVNTDNVTTVMTPAFDGIAESLVTIRLRANGVVVATGLSGADGTDGVLGNSLGVWTLTASTLADGVYAITATAEDAAGNQGLPSASLSVTIANQSLTLSGASSAVSLDLAAGRVSGFPGYPSPLSVVGIVGIPTVNLDANGHALTATGTGGPDTITFTPNSADGGRLTLDGVAQVLNLSGMGGAFTVDPGAGSDKVWVIGTVGADTITADVLATTPVTVGALKTVLVPVAAAELIEIGASDGVDTVNVTTHSGVTAALNVDGDFPLGKKKFSDTLNVSDGSGNGKMRNTVSRVPYSGAVLVTYSSSSVRIDYTSVEKVKLLR